jgi:hypothetical protein
MLGSLFILINYDIRGNWIEKTTEDADATPLLAESWSLTVISDFHD